MAIDRAQACRRVSRGSQIIGFEIWYRISELFFVQLYSGFAIYCSYVNVMANLR